MTAATMTRNATETCERCGGAGGWEGWPGYTCFRCKGTGVCTPYQNQLGNGGGSRIVREIVDTVRFCEACGHTLESTDTGRICVDCTEDRVWDACKSAEYETAERQIEEEEAARRSELFIVDGTYTMVFEDGAYFTFRVDTKTSGKLAGRRLIEFLRGSNNELDFQAFGFVNTHSVNVWRTFERGVLVERAREIEAMIRNDREALEAAGIAYAEMSSRCRRCNRVLTVPASLAAGYGPDCADLMGVAYNG